MVLPGDQRVRSGSLGSLGCTLGVVGFLLDRWVHWGVRPGGHHVSLGSLSLLGYSVVVVGFVQGRWVYWGAS